MAPLFVVQEKPNCNMPDEMKMYQDKTGRETVKGTKELLGVMKTLLRVMRAEKIIFYINMIHWYLGHGLSLKTIFMVSRGVSKC